MEKIGLEPEPYPWFAYYSCDGDQIFGTILDYKRSYMTNHPDLRGKYLVGSYYGWCLFSAYDRNIHPDDVKNMFLWNPSTGENITLPSLAFVEKTTLPSLAFVGAHMKCMFSSSPSDPNCRVFLLMPGICSILFCDLRKNSEWIGLDYGRPFCSCLRENNLFPQEEEALCTPILYNGNLCAVTRKSMRLLIFDEISQDKFSIRCYPVFIPRASLRLMKVYLHLVECFGDLLAVQLFIGGIEYNEVIAVKAHRLDLQAKKWVLVKSLKNFVLFLGRSSVCRLAVDPEIGGRIYFAPNGFDYMCYYDLEAGTLVRVKASPSIGSSDYLLKSDNSIIWVTSDYRHEASTSNSSMEGNINIDIQESYISRINADIVTLITNNLNPTDYGHFRSTCCQYRSVLPIISNFKVALSRRLDTILLHPWLVYESNGMHALFDPTNDENYQLKLSEDLSGSRICGAKDGWLLLCTSEKSAIFYNPITKDLIPTTADRGLFSYFGISSSPTSTDCLLVEWNSSGVQLDTNYISMGQEIWRRNQEIRPDFRFYFNSPVFYCGQFYFLAHDGKLGRIRFKQNWKAKFDVFYQLERPCNFYQQLYLVEFDEQLVSIFVGLSGNRVRVFRLDHFTMDWVELTSIGSYMICVSRLSSFSFVANLPHMKNKIYFPRLYQGNIVYYSMDTNKFHTHKNSAAVDIFGASELLNSAWIMPSDMACIFD